MVWRKGSGTCEVWVQLGFMEATLPLLVSITFKASYVESERPEARQHSCRLSAAQASAERMEPGTPPSPRWEQSLLRPPLAE